VPQFYIQNPQTNLVIDIQPESNEIKPTAGSPLIANTKGGASQLQLWTTVAFGTEVRGLMGWQLIQNVNLSGIVQDPKLPGPFCIDIELTGLHGSSRPKSGTALDAYPEKPADSAEGPDWGLTSNANQLWGFYPDPASGHYYIANVLDDLVIDIMENERRFGPGQPTAGRPLDAFERKLHGSANQLWQFVDANGVAVVPPAQPVPTHNPPPGGNPVQR
jgi:hypothetical protein